VSILSTILINGRKFLGRALRIDNQSNSIFIDGRRIELDQQLKIDIVVQGNLDSLEVGAASTIEVQGSASRVKTGSGNVKCGNVTGDVTSASGRIECAAVEGNVSSASGNISCGTVGGSVKTVTGDVKIRRE